MSVSDTSGNSVAAVVEESAMTTATERAGLDAVRTSGRDFIVQRLRDYVTLTKPRIISLLLVTTLAPMVLAADGWPGWGVVGWTMLGASVVTSRSEMMRGFVSVT